LRAFPRPARIACFPAPGTRCFLSRAWHQLAVACFPALFSSCFLFRARFVPVKMVFGASQVFWFFSLSADYTGDWPLLM